MTKPVGRLVLTKIQQAIYTWVSEQVRGEVAPENVIWRQQSEPLPPRPCVTMKITDGPRRVGYSDHVSHVEGSQFNYGGQRVLTVSIQVLGTPRFIDHLLTSLPWT